ncbi:SphA family protein [Tropicimonas marinistellae]|uniref:SphA family protein n=1 Tax=Tropicimonas marinistellae TaxID=1739787 RepID=UPI00082AC0B6|nr:transporter [Tropicimonas marinistellae]
MQFIARNPVAPCLAAVFSVVLCQQAQAVEGGIGAYFLGSRDTLPAIVPPPGTYLSFIYDRLEGSVEGLSVGGLPIRADANVSVDLYRLSFTQVFDAELMGGTPALNVAIPLPASEIAFQAVTGPLAGTDIDDTSFGVGDTGITGLVGWHDGNMHYNAGLTVFAPTGSYDTASVDVGRRSVDILSNGKNVWSFMPSAGATYFNPESGVEVSGVASLLFSTKNEATDYQTAPALQLEGAIMQRLGSGWGFGVAGYTYQQLGDDSGSGADALRTALGASSLEARVSGAGPVLTYSGGRLFGGDLSLKVKYTSEFGAKRRLESDVFTFNLSLAY